MRPIITRMVIHTHTVTTAVTRMDTTEYLSPGTFTFMDGGAGKDITIDGLRETRENEKAGASRSRIT